MTDEQLILIDEPAEHVRRVTLNRPDKRNAISTPLRVALLGALHGFDRDPDVRVTIVRGAGVCFSSGYDLSGRLTTESNTAKQSTEPACPPDVLAAAASRSDTLRAAAVAHPSCPAAVYKAPPADPVV